MTSRFCVPDSFTSCESITVTGVGALKPREARRDPVTTTVVLSPAADALAGAGAAAWVAPGWGSFGTSGPFMRRTIRVGVSEATSSPVPSISRARAACRSIWPRTGWVCRPLRLLAGATIWIPAWAAKSGMPLTAASAGRLKLLVIPL